MTPLKVTHVFAPPPRRLSFHISYRCGRGHGGWIRMYFQATNLKINWLIIPRRQAITSTSTDIFSFVLLRTKLHWNFNQYTNLLFKGEKAYENAVCETSAIVYIIVTVLDFLSFYLIWACILWVWHLSYGSMIERIISALRNTAI